MKRKSLSRRSHLIVREDQDLQGALCCFFFFISEGIEFRKEFQYSSVMAMLGRIGGAGKSDIFSKIVFSRQVAAYVTRNPWRKAGRAAGIYRV